MQITLNQKLANHPLIFFVFFCIFFLSLRYVSADWLIDKDMFLQH